MNRPVLWLRLTRRATPQFPHTHALTPDGTAAWGETARRQGVHQ